MRILWLTVDRSHRIAQQFDIFRSYVKHIADVVEIVKSPAGDNGENMWQLSRNLINGEIETENVLDKTLTKDSNFDFIFCDAFFAYLEEDWKAVGIPTGILIEDIHQEVPKHQIVKAKEFGIENIFHRFNFGFHKYHPEARGNFKCFWLPHSVDTKRFFYGTNNKKIDVLHVGVCPDTYYPYRARIVRQLADKPYFKRIKRPRELGDRENSWPIDSDYAKLINSAYICITGGSIFDVPVQKYVEIPISNTLLMSNWFSDLGLLGFVPGKNMIKYDLDNVVEVVENTLKDKDRILTIAKEGYDLVSSKHTSQVRSMQFINNICQILNKPLEFKDVLPCSFQVNFNISKIGKKEVTMLKPNPKPRLRPIKEKSRQITGTDWRSRIATANNR